MSPKFGLSDFIQRNRLDRTKNDFSFWLILGLSPNLELSESLSERLNQKVKLPIVYGAVVMAEPLREFTRFIWCLQKEMATYRH